VPVRARFHACFDFSYHASFRLMRGERGSGSRGYAAGRITRLTPGTVGTSSNTRNRRIGADHWEGDNKYRYLTDSEGRKFDEKMDLRDI
jgi:hypothetical protein